MNWFEAVALALLQGLTEFLPISSSGHLVLVPQLLGWPDQGLAFDVAVHLGTLAAVVIYFRNDIRDVFLAWCASLRPGATFTANAQLGWAILVATIPVGIVGLLARDFIEENFRSPFVIAAATAIFGIFLWLADRRGGAGRDLKSIALTAALLIGVAQAFALIPGTSRSGVTITAALALGFSRDAAARFSFLMAIPVITLASLLEIWKLVEAEAATDWAVLIVGAVVSGISAWLCIRWFLAAIARISMLPFAVYRLVLAGVIVAVFI